MRKIKNQLIQKNPLSKCMNPTTNPRIIWLKTHQSRINDDRKRKNTKGSIETLSKEEFKNH